MTARQRQIELERTMVTRGRDRYFEARERDAERGRQYDHPVVGRIMGACMEDLLPAIRKLQAEGKNRVDLALTKGTRLAGWELPLCVADSKTLAYIVLKTAIVSGGEEHTIQRVATIVGSMVSLELVWEQAREAEKQAAKARDFDPPNRIQMLKRTVSEVNPKSVRKWLRRLDDLSTKPLDPRDKYQVGGALLHALLEACPDLVRRKTITKVVHGKPRGRVVLEHTEDLTDAIADGHLNEALSRPWLLPMVYTPAPWRLDTKRGGYLAIPAELVKSSGQYTHSLEPSQDTLDALNAVQNTPWKVNSWVLSWAETAVENRRGPLPYAALLEMPASVPREVWEGMTREERGEHKAWRERVHSHNAKTESQRTATQRCMEVAREMREEPAIYFPHSLDWRGRMYPLPQDLNPQGNDFAKALLCFSEGKRLGPAGLRWLMYHTASCFGLDKEDRTAQELWCHLNHDRIARVASAPMEPSVLEWWSQAEEPWQFLASCRELAEALSLSNPEEYVSHLPVSVDGSCNGLQHLSAMGLDPVGAEAVNLTPGPRRDIYAIVADKVNEAIDNHISTAKVEKAGIGGCLHCSESVCDTCDHVWRGKVNRKVVKRAVMTTPYGLTPIGMRDQLMQDGWCDGLPGDRMQNANILRDLIREAIGDTLRKGTEIMEWMQDCAEAMAKEFNQGLTWETPCGNLVTQSYEQAPLVQVNCLLGRLRFSDSKSRRKGRVVRPSKAKLSVAPNIIHSFDASHLVMTVNLLEDYVAIQDDDAVGPISYAMVHDSFGCHAADMPLLEQAVREAFIDIYSEDQFATLRASFVMEQPVRVARVLEPIAPPERGEFNIELVRDSDWFFA